MARAPVSKTGGCRFESCHSCQPAQALSRSGIAKNSLRVTNEVTPAKTGCSRYGPV